MVRKISLLATVGLLAFIGASAVGPVSPSHAVGDPVCEPRNATGGARIYTVTVLPDDSLLLGGVSGALNGQNNAQGVVLMGADGGVDSNFRNNFAANVTVSALSQTIYALATTGTGFVIGGGFTSTSAGTMSDRIARFNMDGTPDTAWNTTVGAMIKSQVNSLVVEANGDLLVAGNHQLLANDELVVRVQSDGTTDSAYTSVTGDSSSKNRSVIAAAPATTSVFVASSQGHIVLVDEMGTPEWSFSDPNQGQQNWFEVEAVVADGSAAAVVVGRDSFTKPFVGRVTSAGLDSVFATKLGTFPTSSASSRVSTIVAHTRNGQAGYVLGGTFTSFDGVSVSGIARVNTDGTPDTVFNTNIAALDMQPFTNGNPVAISGLGVQSDGSVIVASAAGGGFGFTVSQSAEATTRAANLMRLSAEGIIDPGFNAWPSSSSDPCLPPVGSPEPSTSTPPGSAVLVPSPPIETLPTTTVPEDYDGPRLIDAEMASALSQEPGQAGALIDGAEVSAEVERITVPAALVPASERTPSQVAELQQAAVDLMASFTEGLPADAEPRVSVTNTASGAQIDGLLVDTTDPTIGVPVPVEDVLLLTAGDVRVLLAGADEQGQPVEVPGNILEVDGEGRVAAVAHGFSGNTPGELVLLSTPRLVGTFLTGADGGHSGTYLLPEDIEPGYHTLVLTTGDRAVSLGVVVAGPDTADTPAVATLDGATLPATGIGLSGWIAMIAAITLSGVTILTVRRRPV
jgi:hypothetical protein